MAKKLLRLISSESLPGSQLKHVMIKRMIEEDVIAVRTAGGLKKHLFVTNPENLKNYLKNHFGINDLLKYVEKLEGKEMTRSTAVKIASNSKLKRIRTFSGFPVNCYSPVNATLNNQPIVIQPCEGIFTFIYDFAQFAPSTDTIIIGIENPENFRYVEKQTYLFGNCKPLFVSRYPQSKDLIKWLQSIPNNYIHFGDFDFEGINLYYNEFKKYLKERATFFVPGNVEELLEANGNRTLYDKQSNRKKENITEDGIVKLLSLMHKYKKCLEQEIYISSDDFHE
ncbi:MAG: hypothetical protein NUV58_01500 [Candidatus Roizmanbacteria bacterium]|nr:hypothetical protein [Candidatus Roizmanbacteria bacterium]